MLPLQALSLPGLIVVAILTLAMAVALAVGGAVVLTQMPPAVAAGLRQMVRLLAGIPMVVMLLVLVTMVPPPATWSSSWLAPLLLALVLTPKLTVHSDHIVRGIAPPLQDAAAALGASPLSITLTLVMPAAFPALAGAALAAGAQALGALLTVALLQAATAASPGGWADSPASPDAGLGPLVLVAAAATLLSSTLVGIYVEDFAGGTRWHRRVDGVIAWLSALPPLVYATLLLVVMAAARHSPPGAAEAALLFALLLGPHAALAVRSALASVPVALREASWALGASRRQTLRQLVLPAAARPMLRRLSGAVAKTTADWGPLVLIGVAATDPAAMPSWSRGMQARWDLTPASSSVGDLMRLPAGFVDVPPAIWLLVGLTLAGVWLLQTRSSLREFRSW